MPEKIIRTRPWTQHHVSPAKLYRQQRAEIKTPVINTYAKQLQQCDRLYDKVTTQFKMSEEKLPKISGTNVYLHSGFHRSNATKSAPGTFYYDDSAAIQRLERSLRNHFAAKRHHTEYADYNRHHFEFADESRSTSDQSDNFDVDPFQLSDMLYRRGLRKPVLVQYDKNGFEITKTKTRKIRPNKGILPKNPSVREKIKGRARLDYEMANMRAVAFCEQQAQRKFRTASANMRNRDVELVEEDFLERINRGDNNYNNDDTGSIIMSIDKDELFERIQKWIEDVRHAFGNSSHPSQELPEKT